MTDETIGGIGEHFEKFRAALPRRFGEKIVNSWLSDLRIEAITVDSVTLSTASPLRCDTISRHYLGGMRKTWIDVVGPVARVKVVTRAQLAEDAARVNGASHADAAKANGRLAEAASAKEEAKGASSLDELVSSVDERQTFEAFAVDPSNEMAFAAARQVFADGAPVDVIYLNGPSGVGKTHLLAAIANEHRRRGGEACAYLTYSALRNGCVTAVWSNGIVALHRDIATKEILLIDDIHLLSTSHRTQLELLDILKSASGGRRLVIAGELTPGKLAEAGMNAQLADRLAGGLSVSIRPGDASHRARVLRKRLAAQRPACEIGDDAIDYVAEQFGSSLRETIGACNQLVLAYHGAETRVGREEAERALRVRISEARRKPTLDDAAAAVAAAFDISVGELKGRCQQQRVARPRHAFVHVCREALGESFPRIARHLGRDHTTAMSGYRRGQDLLKRDKKFAAQIAGIRQALGRPEN